MRKPKVFVSYSHDSPEHRGKVLNLSERLRQDGITTILDRYVNGSPEEGWPRWMLDQLDIADFVLVVCTETYYRRFRGHEEPGKGKGVDWEGAVITQKLYDHRTRTLKYVPVYFSPVDADWIPEPLRPFTRYLVTSEDQYQDLYDFLLGQSGIEPGPLGQIKTRERTRSMPLTFGEAQRPPMCQADISRVLGYAPAELIGREEELKRLDDAWTKVQNQDTARPRVLTFVALGGEGKTSLIAKWAAELAHRNWPGCDAAFAWSFYSQGTREQLAASSDLFLKEALVFFASTDEDREFAAGPAGSFNKGQHLASLVGQRKCLLILDGLEPLQYAPTAPTLGQLKDQGIAVLLKRLATSSHGLCVVTTRYSLPDLKAFWQGTAPEVKLERLSREAGVHLLKTLGVKGSELRNIPFNCGKEQVNEFEKLVEDVKGHALTLNLLGTYLRDAHGGDIRKRDLAKLEEADAEEQGGHAFRVMDAYSASFKNEGDKGQRALAVLRLLGLFDRPATADCLAALLEAPGIPDLTEPLAGTSAAEKNVSFSRLEAARLLTVNRDTAGAPVSLDAHPLLRDYFARQLREQKPDAWRAAHRRLYEHLRATTKEGDQPTLEDLQPLCQAVAHGCQAGLQEEALKAVYCSRISGPHVYSQTRLGAFGADLGVARCFFEQPWTDVSPSLSRAAQAYVLNLAGFCLRALGRPSEALEPMRASLEMSVEQTDWRGVVTSAANVNGLLVVLGDLATAVKEGQQFVAHTDAIGDLFLQMYSRVPFGYALFQSGSRKDAERWFREAEGIQVLGEPFPLLYSLQGFQYCELLLSISERAAWQKLLSFISPCPQSEVTSVALEECTNVAKRSEQTLARVRKKERFGPIDEARNYLTLGRTALYASILQSETADQRHTAAECIEQAVKELRVAGEQDQIPEGLLSRAWLRSRSGDRVGAKVDLDEAWEIAERGPMRLLMADIHLYRARLFFREVQYPWGSPQSDLVAARKLIEQCGYWRRKEELEDAEAAIGSLS